jgi:hypothetical protein
LGVIAPVTVIPPQMDLIRIKSYLSNMVQNSAFCESDGPFTICGPSKDVVMNYDVSLEQVLHTPAGAILDQKATNLGNVNIVLGTSGASFGSFELGSIYINVNENAQ